MNQLTNILLIVLAVIVALLEQLAWVAFSWRLSPVPSNDQPSVRMAVTLPASIPSGPRRT